MTVLVTGATGTIGFHVTQFLLDAGVSVRASGRSADEVTRRFGDRVQAVGLDFTDPATYPAAFDGAQSMFLMRPPQLGKPKTQMFPALNYARRAGVGHMVFLSLQGAESNKVVPHAAIEQWLIDATDVTHTFVRASFFMENLSGTLRSDIAERDQIIVPAGRGATAFVDGRDVAEVAACALLDPAAHAGKAWTPTGPEALTYDQVAQILTDVLGRPITYTHPGVLRFAIHARRALKMPWGMVGVTSAIYTIARAGKAAGLTGDVKAVTGHEPTGMRAFAERERNAWDPDTSKRPSRR